MRTTLLLAALSLSGFAVTDLAAQNRADAGFVRPNPDRIVPAPAGGPVGCPGTSVGATLPFSDTGTTCGGTNSINNYSSAACLANLNFPYPGPETVYQVTLGTGNNVAFSADLAGSTGDLALFLLGTCGSGASCIDTSQDAIGPGTGPELIEAASYTPGTYFVYIDSYYGSGGAACGTYTLNVTGTVPVELESFDVL